MAQGNTGGALLNAIYLFFSREYVYLDFKESHIYHKHFISPIKLKVYIKCQWVRLTKLNVIP